MSLSDIYFPQWHTDPRQRVRPNETQRWASDLSYQETTAIIAKRANNRLEEGLCSNLSTLPNKAVLLSVKYYPGNPYKMVCYLNNTKRLKKTTHTPLDIPEYLRDINENSWK